MGRAGIEPATQTRRFYRPLPTPIGEPTHIFLSNGLRFLGEIKEWRDQFSCSLPSQLKSAVPTGIEPAISCLKDRWLYQFAYGTKSEISTTYKFEKLFLTASRFGGGCRSRRRAAASRRVPTSVL